MARMNVDSAHGTLVAATVTSVSLAPPTNENIQSVEVINVDGADEIYFTMDESNPTNPTVAGADTRVVPAVKGASYSVDLGSARNVVVELISAGTPAYAVIAELR